MFAGWNGIRTERAGVGISIIGRSSFLAGSEFPIEFERQNP
jgi:hypothetical protein